MLKKLSKEEYLDSNRLLEGKCKEFEEEFTLLKIYANSSLAPSPNVMYSHKRGNQQYDAVEKLNDQETKLEFCFLKVTEEERKDENFMLGELTEMEKNPELYDEKRFKDSLNEKEELYKKHFKDYSKEELLNKKPLSKNKRKQLKKLNKDINPNYIQCGIRGEYKDPPKILEDLEKKAEQKSKKNYEDNTKIIFGVQYDTSLFIDGSKKDFKSQAIDILKEADFHPTWEIIIIFIESNLNEEPKIQKVK